VSGSWFLIGYNMDLPAPATANVYNNPQGTGFIGSNIYSSADLRNWTWKAVANQAVSQNGTGGFYGDRSKIIYNAANNNYVLWARKFTSTGGTSPTYGGQIDTYTSSNPTGPWTFIRTMTSFGGNAYAGGDFTLLVDGTTGYFVTNGQTAGVIFQQLSSDYTNVAGAATTSLALEPIEGFTAIKIGATFYLMGSNQGWWSPSANNYFTNTSFVGTGWSAATNPFQAVAAGFPSNSTSFNTQPLDIIQIPGRNGPALLYFGDSYNVPDEWGTAPGDSFINYRLLIQPVTYTAGALSIVWTPSWNLDSTFSPSSGQPAAASNLALTTSAGVATLSWTNNEPKAYALYLDRATDPAFTLNLVSEVLASGQTSFADSLLTPGTTYYYRVRTVNASGSSVSHSINNAPLPPATQTAAVHLIPQVGLPPNYFSRSKELSMSYDALIQETSFIFNPFGPQQLNLARTNMHW
jgi:hypothetical protein